MTVVYSRKRIKQVQHQKQQRHLDQLHHEHCQQHPPKCQALHNSTISIPPANTPSHMIERYPLRVSAPPPPSSLPSPASATTSTNQVQTSTPSSSSQTSPPSPSPSSSPSPPPPPSLPPHQQQQQAKQKKIISKKTRRRKRSFTQTHIDAGQRDLSSRQCPVCHMVYAPGATNDSLIHLRYHSRHLRNRDTGIPLPSSAALHPGHLSVVRSTDEPRLRAAVYAVDAAVDAKLSSSESALRLERGPDTAPWLAVLYLCPRDRRFVQGFLLAEVASAAVPARVQGALVMTEQRKLAPDDEAKGRGKNIAFCGVRKVWVHHAARRAGIASKMIDLAREQLVYGLVIDRRFTAFTPTTPDGTRFALAYTKETRRSETSTVAETGQGDRIYIYIPPTPAPDNNERDGGKLLSSSVS